MPPTTKEKIAAAELMMLKEFMDRWVARDLRTYSPHDQTIIRATQNIINMAVIAKYQAITEVP